MWDDRGDGASPGPVRGAVGHAWGDSPGEGARGTERGLLKALARAAKALAELGCGGGATTLERLSAVGRGCAPEGQGRWFTEGVGRCEPDHGEGGLAPRDGMAGVGPKRGSPAIAAGSGAGRSVGRWTNAAARLWSRTAAVAEAGKGARTSSTKRCSQWVREGMADGIRKNGRFRQTAVNRGPPAESAW